MVHVDKGVPYTPVARQMAASYRVEISNSKDNRDAKRGLNEFREVTFHGAIDRGANLQRPLQGCR